MNTKELQDYVQLEKRALRRLKRQRHRNTKLLNQARGPRWFAHAWTSKTGLLLLLLYISHSILFTFSLDKGTVLEGQGPATLYYLFILIGVRLVISFKHTTLTYLNYKLTDLDDHINNKLYNIETTEGQLRAKKHNAKLDLNFEVAA